jgi:putative membrane-bound dehydrogenase-like protein
MNMPNAVFWRSCLVLVLVAVPGALTLAGRQAPPAPARPAPPPVRLAPADAAKRAEDARKNISVELAPGLEVTLWAPSGFVTDPVALDLDPEGRVYVTSTSRNNLPLDIRQHPYWFTSAHTLKTVEDLRAFYARELAPARSARNMWIPDLNNDGSHDLRDFRELKERLHRIQDTDGDGLADLSEIMIEGFNEDPTWDVAGGLLYHEGDLYFGVPPGVYKLRDTNGDGVIDSRVTIGEGYNIHPAFGGHGVSGVTLGPDGRLYWEVGDIGFNVVDGRGRRWAYANQGGVFRSELDGSNLEVFATGIRNLQEFAFDELGNLISVDNDGDHQGETERLVYIPEGSDSGWRANWQYGKYTDPDNNRYNVWMDEGLFKPRFEGQGAHIVPPIAPYHAGPAGMVYNPGTALSEEWRNTFLVSSFTGATANTRIYAFRLKPEGAGFALDTDKMFVQGILTVGMKIGPDGALYLADWITGWDSKNDGRIWKVDVAKATAHPARAEVHLLLKENFATRPAADLSGLLRHIDMRVRTKAQFELVRRGDSGILTAAARQTEHRLGRIHGIWGIGQLARKDNSQAAALTPLLQDGDAEIRAQAARLIGDVRYAPPADTLLPLLKDGSPRVRFFAAEALGRLAHKPAVNALVEMIAANDDKDVYLRHAGSYALSRIGDTAALAALHQHSSRGVRVAALVALRRMKSAEVARFVSDADEWIATEAARAINDDGSIDAALPALAGVLGPSRFTNAALLRRAINANLRLGTLDAVERVAAFAGDRMRPAPLRVEAIQALGVWAKPSPLDRVDGIYLGSPAGPRPAAAARRAVQRLIQRSDRTESTPELKIALADAAARLGATGAAPVLLEYFQNDPSPDVRIAALRALQSLKAPNMGELMRVALADKDASVRRAALGVLPSLPLTPAAKVSHLSALIKNGSIEEQQSALEVLGTLKSPAATRLLTDLARDLTAGNLPVEVQADVIDAIQSSGRAPLEATLEAYRASKSADSLPAAFRDALLRGGNSRRGAEVYRGNALAGCPRCHALGGRGSEVGPNLSRIGAVLTREQLVEALLDPNARIAPGYGMVGVTLRDGKQVSGRLMNETDTHLIVGVGTPLVEQRIPKTDILNRTNPGSAMPPMGKMLRPREARDLVEFLSTLK